MRFTRGGKLMSRIKERVFFNVVIINSARAPAKSARVTHTHAEKKNVKRTHTSAVKSAHQEQERPAEKRKSVDDGGGGLTTRHQQQNKREEAEETSEKNDEIWLSYVAV